MEYYLDVINVAHRNELIFNELWYIFDVFTDNFISQMKNVYPSLDMNDSNLKKPKHTIVDWSRAYIGIKDEMAFVTYGYFDEPRHKFAGHEKYIHFRPSTKKSSACKITAGLKLLSCSLRGYDYLVENAPKVKEEFIWIYF